MDVIGQARAGLTNDWAELLAPQFASPGFVRLAQFVEQEYRQGPVFPSQPEIFHALRLTACAQTRVVILGQDPYHGAGQAHGLSFSVRPGVPLPRSLRNIFTELQNDVGCTPPGHGCLEHWARQGVLLLNTVLTVREGAAASHRGRGWEALTDRVIACLNSRSQPVVFVLWGSHAQAKRALVTEPCHALIESAHPSPLSARRGFLGSRPFSRINAFLNERGLGQIDWQLPPLE